MKNGLLFISGLFLLSFIACAPVQPAKPMDPAYRWASGKWIAQTA
jgi:hypothetical protein